LADERRAGSGPVPAPSGCSSGTHGVVGGYPGFVCGLLAMSDRCYRARMNDMTSGRTMKKLSLKVTITSSRFSPVASLPFQ
jgi:hypothetical protein